MHRDQGHGVIDEIFDVRPLSVTLLAIRPPLPIPPHFRPSWPLRGRLLPVRPSSSFCTQSFPAKKTKQKFRVSRHFKARETRDTEYGDPFVHLYTHSFISSLVLLGHSLVFAFEFGSGVGPSLA